MVAHRQMLPIRQQRILRIAEHLADVGGVLLAGIEIDEVADLDREQHLHRLSLDQQAPVEQQLGDPVAHGPPVGPAQRDKSIQ